MKSWTKHHKIEKLDKTEQIENWTNGERRRKIKYALFKNETFMVNLKHCVPTPLHSKLA